MRKQIVPTGERGIQGAMAGVTGQKIILLRHAPLAEPGRLFGRIDAAPDLSDRAALDALRAQLPGTPRILSSPARRCTETAAALYPGAAIPTDPDLWEQNFGAWEGLAFGDLPDLGPLPDAELAGHRPPDGESFTDLQVRVRRALEALSAGSPTLIVAHAGVIRAALGVALGGSHAALRFDIPCLSTTAITRLSGGGYAIGWVNRVAR